MARHRWPDDAIVREDHTTTRRTCPNCGLVKITRHEPDNDPPHWVEWERDGRRFQSKATPTCEEALVKTDTPKEYRLVELRAENVKALKAVAIKIDGTMLKISGRNGAGKSSILDAVAMAIGGKDAFPKEPVRKGEDKASIFLDFGGIKLTRRIWNKDGGGIGHDLVLEYADGKRPADKQSLLDKLRGSPIADDPLAFATKLKPKERYDLLKQLVPGFDFEDHAQKRQDLFDERTQVGREATRARAAADATVIPEGAPKAPIDISDLGKRLEAGYAHNEQIRARAARREGFADELEAMRDQADSMAAALKKLNEDIAAREKQIVEAEELPEPIDTEALNEQVRNASALNAAAGKRTEKAEKETAAKALEESYEAMSKQIEGMDKAKTAAIETAKLPVPELSFGVDDILLDNLPFDQASTARKIRVSTALLMALKPQLRVLLIREGSLLDDDARAALQADAEANDFVVLLECVGGGDGTGIIVEDGEIV